MRNKWASVILIFSFLTPVLFAQQESIQKGLNAITNDVIKAQLEFIASDWTQGRETGTEGCYLAADYIASLFKIYGIKPAGDVEWIYPSRSERMKGKQPVQYTSYFQNFSLIDYEPGDVQQFAIISDNNSNKSKYNFEYETDFSIYPSSVGIEVEAPVVFVGYGYKNDEQNYNDFENVDVNGKFILRLSGYPGHKDSSSESYKKFHPEGRWAEYYLMREKNNIAEELGAIGIIEVKADDDITSGWAKNFPFRYNDDNFEGTERLTPGVMNRMSLPGDTLSNRTIGISLTMRAANELIKGTGISFSKFEEDVRNDPEPDSKELDNKLVFLNSTVKSKIIKARNVVGIIEGENPEEVVIAGAHYDHVGMNKEYIWNGSDDNASGTVGVLTLAKAFAETDIKPKKTIVFALWSGEEKGLLGSRYFVDHPVKPLENIVAYLNYDMISRDNDDDSLGVKCSMTYTAAYPELEDKTKKYNEDLSLELDISYRASERPRGGSDHSPFAGKEVPIFYFMAGFHPDYHQPSDHVDKANIDKMNKIIKLGFMNIFEIANREGKLKVVKK